MKAPKKAAVPSADSMFCWRVDVGSKVTVDQVAICEGTRAKELPRVPG